MTDTATEPRILQPRFPGTTKPLEYEIDIHYTGEPEGEFGTTKPGTFTTTIPGHHGIDEALRVFRAIAGTRRDNGYVNLIAWTGADHSLAVGVILDQHSWERE